MKVLRVLYLARQTENNMTIYDDLLPVTKEIMSEFKQGTVNYIQITPGAGSADNPGTPTETFFSLDAVVSGVSFKYVSNGFAVSTDLMVTSATVDGVTVDEKGFIEIDGTRYKIIRDMSAPAAGGNLVWKFIVRKGG